MLDSQGKPTRDGRHSAICNFAACMFVLLAMASTISAAPGELADIEKSKAAKSSSHEVAHAVAANGVWAESRTAATRLSAPAMTSEPDGPAEISILYATNRAAPESRLELWRHAGRYFVYPLGLMLVAIIVARVGRRRLVWRGVALVALVVAAGLSWWAWQHTQHIWRTSARGGSVYTNRPGQLKFGIARATIPSNHSAGHVEGPNLSRAELGRSPNRHVALARVQSLNEDQFAATLSDHAARDAEQHILVYVHGYNERFDQAARRAAVFAHDMQFRGQVVLFAWPSQGDPLRYGSDARQAAGSAAALRRLLEVIAERAEPARLSLIAHSLGNRAAVEAVAGLPRDVKLHQLILAAPDVDAAKLRSHAEQLVKRADRTTLYVSSRDYSLRMSHAVNRAARAGDAVRGPLLLARVETIDTSAVKTYESLGHTYFRMSPRVMADLRALLCDDAAAAYRPGLKLVASAAGGPGHWVMLP